MINLSLALVLRQMIISQSVLLLLSFDIGMEGVHYLYPKLHEIKNIAVVLFVFE